MIMFTLRFSNCNHGEPVGPMDSPKLKNSYLSVPPIIIYKNFTTQISNLSHGWEVLLLPLKIIHNTKLPFTAHYQQQKSSSKH